MAPHPFTNVELQKYQNEPKLSGVCSRNSLSKIKDGRHIINLDESEPIGTHWMALHVNAENITYLDSFGVEHIRKGVRKFMGNKNIIANKYRTQAYDSVMCGYFCIGFIDFMFKGKSLLKHANLFSPNKYNKKDKIVL